MPLGRKTLKLDKSAGLLRRFLAYTFHDWTREMPRSKRILTYVGLLLQGYAFYSLLMWAFMLPKLDEWLREVPWLSANLLLLPKRPASGMLVILGYLTGHWIQNGMLASELVRKTQLETEQTAARQIQQTLQPEKLEPLSGYELETFYKPLREVGGDYFDVMELPGNETLFALADVSGKGMAAALLAANIQALVRSIARVDCSPLALATQINKHLNRYSPMDRFATAVFIVLKQDSGELTYVNAGHNAPMVFSCGSATFLEATGLPLGLFSDAAYEVRKAVIERGGTLLVFTDGLTDSIQGEHPENRVRDAFAESAGQMMANLRSLVDPKFNEDDVTVLLVKRTPDFAHSGISAKER
jgi:sigma-B regulation protein RsbU (phosphoserine phosphatase)